MKSNYSKKKYWLILIIIILLSPIIGCTQIKNDFSIEKLEESTSDMENDDVNTLAKSQANLTSPSTLPAEEKSEIVTPPAESTSVTGNGWVKTIDLTHVCKESCPGEFELALLLSVQQTSEGGYVTAGSITNLTHLADGQIIDTGHYPYILEMDADGNSWNKTYDARGVVNSFKQTSDGGYI